MDIEDLAVSTSLPSPAAGRVQPVMSRRKEVRGFFRRFGHCVQLTEGAAPASLSVTADALPLGHLTVIHRKLVAQAPSADDSCRPGASVPGSQSVWVKTFGCAHNISDSEYMAGLLSAYGYRLTSLFEGDCVPCSVGNLCLPLLRLETAWCRTTTASRRTCGSSTLAR